MGLISIGIIGICLLCWSVIPASAVSSGVIGETVHLSGKGGGYDDMYLFLTGPNLAPGGVRLDSITRPVVSGTAVSFTRASVRNGAWEYDWDTGRTGGTLDPGTYLVWVTPTPLDRHDISGTSYATMGFRLTNPALTAGISGDSGDDAPEGTVNVTAEETPEEIAPSARQEYPGNENITEDMDNGTKGVQQVSDDAPPQPTTAGSFSSPFVCAAGIGIIFLIITGIKTEK